MIAIKLQIARDEWGKETCRLKDTLEEERAKRLIREELTLIIHNLQKDFVRKHQSQLVTHAHDMVTTREIIQRILSSDVNGCDMLYQFKDNLDKFLEQMANILNQRDALYYEKDKCLRMLGITDDPKIGLDKVISRATGLAIDAYLQTVDKDDIIKKLQKQVDELERQNKATSNSVKEFRKQLAERDREIAKLRQMVVIK